MDARNIETPLPVATQTEAEEPATRAVQTLKSAIGDRLARRPVTTAAIAMLVGAVVAEAVALFVTKGLARMALRRSARANLRLARDLDPDPDRLD